MNDGTSYVFPVLLAVIVHAIAIAGVTLGWHGTKAEVVRPDELLYIEAMLVKENPIKAKERKQAADEKRRQSAAAAENKARDEKARQVAAAQPKPAAVPQKEQAAKKAESEQFQGALEAEAEKEIESRRQIEIAEEERKQMQWSLTLSALEEQAYRRAVTDDEKAQAYVAQITRDIVANWSRPPSARNGMQAVLKVYLAPTGEVVNVAVLESSGNEAFDRSALLAVQKARRFLVPTDPRQFERNFREFSVLFRPEDLRQ